MEDHQVTDGVRNVTVTDRQTESNPFPLVFERHATMMTHDCKVVDRFIPCSSDCRWLLSVVWSTKTK
jgi:hypothetical protein